MPHGTTTTTKTPSRVPKPRSHRIPPAIGEVLYRVTNLKTNRRTHRGSCTSKHQEMQLYLTKENRAEGGNKAGTSKPVQQIRRSFVPPWGKRKTVNFVKGSGEILTTQTMTLALISCQVKGKYLTEPCNWEKNWDGILWCHSWHLAKSQRSGETAKKKKSASCLDSYFQSNH